MSARQGDLDLRDIGGLRRSFELADIARRGGNAPFGAVLLDGDGTVLHEGHNTVATTGDVTAHAETNVAREAAARFPRPVLRRASLYSSAEPCAMCAGAVFWSGIGRLVFGLPDGEMRRLLRPDEPVLAVDCRSILLGAVAQETEVIGPALIDEARSVHQ